MKIDLFLVQVAVIFLPGLIWAGLDTRYAQKSKQSEFQFTLRAFLFGLASHAVTFAAYSAMGLQFGLSELENSVGKSIFSASNFQEIAIATVIGFMLAILWLYVANYKLDTRFLQWIKATKTYGDEDVWDFTFNSPSAAVEYIHYRDFANRIVYAGWVQEFSETDKLRELVLKEVEIYDFDGNLLFDQPLIYLARNPDNIHIEFPYRPLETG